MGRANPSDYERESTGPAATSDRLVLESGGDSEWG
jgi:hypothetical protein